ncbi:hypothetical protein M0802_009495 [Mischocyttarus mexicanus]|nr:hypothetical protein M0802_009495 [Mischocyttarus mexicanus]
MKKKKKEKKKMMMKKVSLPGVNSFDDRQVDSGVIRAHSLARGEYFEKFSTDGEDERGEPDKEFVESTDGFSRQILKNFVGGS